MTSSLPKEELGLDSLVGRVADEFLQRQEQGECPDVEEYTARYPEAASVLRKVLGSLQLLDLSQSDHEGQGAAEGTIKGTLGDFQILRELGRGGMGVVYEADQISLNRRVALKVLPFAATMDPRHLQRFKNEAMAAAHLDHPHIVDVHGVGVERGVHYYAMRLIDGHTIAEVITQLRQLHEKDGAMPESVSDAFAKSDDGCDDDSTQGYTPCALLSRPEDQVEAKDPSAAKACHTVETKPEIQAALSTKKSTFSRAYFRSIAELAMHVAEALEHAHQEGILHRDIKPSNLMLDGRGKIWVTDFGLARMDSGGTLTLTGDLIGTVRYMSPEQALAKRVPLDHRTDIYSLGVTLYELLTLRPAYAGEDRQELLRQISFEEPKALRKLNRSIPSELETIVLKAMEKNPGERYATAAELAEDLRRYVNDEPIKAKRPSYAQVARRWARRHKTLVCSAVAVLLISCVILGASIGWIVRDRTARQAEAAMQARESLNRARSFIGQHSISLARRELAAAKARIANDWAALQSLAAEIELLEDELGRFENFLKLVEKAHEAEIPRAMDLVLVNRIGQATESRARLAQNQGRVPAKVVAFLLQALEHYDVLQRKDWNSALEQSILQPVQIELVRRTIYEELLWLADDAVRRAEDHMSGRSLSPEESARQALTYLSKAKQAHPATSAFYRIRSQCRKRLSDEQAAQADQRRARQTQAMIALDHSLLGQAAVIAREKAKAVKHFEAALRVEPAHYWSLLRLGNCLVFLGEHEQDFKTAIAVLTGCIMHRPDHAWAYIQRSNAYLHLGSDDEAVADATKAVELEPENAHAWSRRGLTYAVLRQYHNALADCTQAIKLDPNHAPAWYYRGTVCAYLGQQHNALADYTQAIELDPYLDVAWDNRGVVYHRLGQDEKAVADISKAIELDPHDAQSWHNRASVYRVLGQLDKALHDFSKVTELKPADADAWSNRGAAYGERGELRQAIADFSKAIEIDPQHVLAWSNRGLNYCKLGQPTRALADHTKAIKLDPNFARAWYRRGLTYAKLWRYHDALRDFSKTIKLDSKFAKAWYSRGLTYANLGDFHKALADWNEAITLDPKFATAWYNRAILHDELGQGEEAIAGYHQAIELNPNYAAAHCNLGQLLRRKGQFVEALTYLRKGHELGSKRKGWPYPSAAWVATCQRLADFETKLTKLKRGERLPGAQIFPGNLTTRDVLDSVRKQSFSKVHTIRLEAEKIYRIDLVSPDFDTFLRVQDSAKKPLKENDDTSELDQNSRVTFIPPRTDTYHLVVTSFQPGQTGKYFLGIQEHTRPNKKGQQ